MLLVRRQEDGLEQMSAKLVKACGPAADAYERIGSISIELDSLSCIRDAAILVGAVSLIQAPTA
jgi:hypothetical protein